MYMQNKIKRLLVYVAAILFVTGCDSEDAWDMLKARGSHKTETRELAAFTGITVHNGINVVLEKSDKFEAVLDGWSNLIPKVSLSIDGNGMLTLKDSNKFDFVRNPSNKTTVRLYYNGEISSVSLQGDGLISHVDTLHTSALTILCEGASGSINLAVSTTNVGIGTNAYNVGDITLSGTATYLGINNWGNAPIQAQELQVQSCDVTHHGPCDLYLNVANTLSATLYTIGSIYYKGNPGITVNRKGKGNVYPL